MQFIDANIILRYLLNDDPNRSLVAKKIIEENVVETPIEVLCEVVFVLKKVYGVNRKDITDTLLDFYKNTKCILQHRKAVIKGIQIFGDKGLDFVDCLLAGYCEVENIPIHTFDEKLGKLLASIKNKQTSVT